MRSKEFEKVKTGCIGSGGAALLRDKLDARAPASTRTKMRCKLRDRSAGFRPGAFQSGRYQRAESEFGAPVVARASRPCEPEHTGATPVPLPLHLAAAARIASNASQLA